ncbi:MAG: leucine-rich repeat protein [Clostridia bacterium]|nr:leucine-rich repeat protein [Clostridia bacterium]
MKAKQRIKLFIILGVEFLAIAIMLVLIFFAGKKVYTVTFDLDGGKLLSGDPVQKVTQGQNATPPQATKEGCYFLKWSASYREITRDVVIKAIWEYETTYGIEYNSSEDSNYCTISGCFSELAGDVYIGAYHGEKKVLGIEAGAFEDCDRITKIHLLDGILTIGENAFKGCDKLESIELPDTTLTIGNNAFEGCGSLRSVTLPADLEELGDFTFLNCIALEEVVFQEKILTIGEGAFSGCEALKEVIIPLSVEKIGMGAFDGAELMVYAFVKEEEKPDGWATDWLKNGSVTWGYTIPEEEEEGTKKDDKR